MANSDYIEHLEAKLEQVDQMIKHAKSTLAGDDAATKPRAIEELAHLHTRHADLIARVEAAKAKGAEHWSALHASFQEEADALADTLEKWLTKF